MKCCSCNIPLIDEGQYYNLLEIGSEIRSIVLRNLNREINYKSLLCENCFTSAASLLSLESRVVSEDQCVWCQRYIIGRHSHSLPNGPEKDDIARRILPRQIQPANRVCYACWLAARRNVQRAQHQELMKMGHITSSTPPLPSQPEPSTSQSEPSTTQPEPSTSQPEPSTSQPEPSTSQPEPSTSQPEQSTSQLESSTTQDDRRCVWCQASLAKRHSHSLLEGPERDYIAQRISPRLITAHSRVCYRCWISARRKSRIVVEEVADVSTNNESNVVSLTTLPNYRRTSNSERSCFVHGCINVERHAVPTFLRYHILKSNKLYITQNARICSYHLGVFDWEFLNEYSYINQFTPSQLEAVISLALTLD